MFNDQEFRMRRKKKFFMLPAIILLFFGLTAAVQYLWNAVLPGAVHAGTINYWEAMGLLALSRILFGRLHFGGRGGRPDFKESWQWREKWMGMSDEERIKFKEEFRDRCRSWKHDQKERR